LIYGRCFKHIRSYFKNVPQDCKSSGAGDKKNKLDESTKESNDPNIKTFPNMEEYNTSMADNSFLDFFILGERHSYAITKPYKVENSTSDKRLVTPSNEDVYGGKEVKL